MISAEPTRLALLAGLLCVYALVCVAPWLRARRKRRLALAAAPPAQPGAASWLVAFASQTGNAELLAEQTAAMLRLAGIGVRLAALDQVTADDLRRAERALFLVSTYGEGDAPDNAAVFASRVQAGSLPLAQLHYAVLALGDASYQQFCGYGRALDAWLATQGAARLFGRIDVDRSADGPIAEWRHQLSHLAGTSDAPDWSAPAFADWRLLARRLLNPGSAGAPLFHLELVPADGPLPSRQSGDLVQVAAPAEPERPREYSIASLPDDGRLHLLVRLQRRADGGAGLVSGWLTGTLDLGQTLPLRLRVHRRFRLEANAARPLLLIGNGSGMAGLRGHLKARALAGQHDNWLLFGERNVGADSLYGDELAAWQAAGHLARLDLVFSRDGAQGRYVQDRLLEQAALVRTWLERGAAVYVCGSLTGMAGGVDQALADIVGRPALDQLAAEGRYRRDVY